MPVTVLDVQSRGQHGRNTICAVKALDRLAQSTGDDWSFVALSRASVKFSFLSLSSIDH